MVELSAPAARSVVATTAVIAADDFEPVQRAIAAATADGKVLSFPRDTYYAHAIWIVDKAITIEGNGSRLLSGGGLDIRGADRVIIRNLVLTTAGSAISLNRAKNVQIKDVEIQGVANAITVLGSDKVRLDNVRIENAVKGISVLGRTTGFVVKDYHFKASSREQRAVIPLEIGGDSDVRSENMYLEGLPSSGYQDLTTHSGELQYAGITYRNLARAIQTVGLRPIMSNVRVPIPDGIRKGIRFFIKDKTGIKAVRAQSGSGGD